MENWVRSEFNIYMSVKEFFKDKRVFYRYRPIWLKGDSGYSLEFDIYLPDDGIAIEHNGNIHNLNNSNIIKKRQLCKDFNINLLVIGSSDDCDLKIDNSNINLYNKLIVEKSIMFIIYNLDITLEEKESLLFNYQSQTKKLIDFDILKSNYKNIIDFELTPEIFNNQMFKYLAENNYFINYNDLKLLCVRNMCLLLEDECVERYINANNLTYKRAYDIEIHGKLFRCYKI